MVSGCYSSIAQRAKRLDKPFGVNQTRLKTSSRSVDSETKKPKLS